MSRAPSTNFLAESLAAELERFADLDWKLQGLKGGSPAYLVAALLAHVQRPVLLVMPRANDAEVFVEELRTLSGEDSEGEFLSRRIHLLPPRETPPLEMVSPSPDVEAARTAAVYQLSQMKSPVIVTSPAALVLRTAPPAAVLDSALYLVVGDALYLEEFNERLEYLGYRRSGAVEEPGESAVRGGIVDLWPPGFDYPCRCELVGDCIESIRFFDPDDQRSFQRSEELLVLPTLAFPLSRLSAKDLRAAVQARCEDLLIATSERRRLDDQLATGVHFPGVELFAPYVFDRAPFFGEGLPPAALRIFVDPGAIDEALDEEEALLAEAAAAASEAGGFFPEPRSLYVDHSQLREFLSSRPAVEIDMAEAYESSGEPGHRVWRVESSENTGVKAARIEAKARRGEDGFGPVLAALQKIRDRGERLIVTASNAAQADRLEQLLGLPALGELRRSSSFTEALRGDPRFLWIVRAQLRAGFDLPADRLRVVTDEEIFGERRERRRRRRASRAYVRSALAGLAAGDYVVHVDHGVGRYHGLKHLLAAGTEGDFLHLEYAGGDRYYLPVDRIKLVEKYVGSGTASPALDRLGGSAWVRSKKRVRDSVLEMARELLDLEAFRSVHERESTVEVGSDFAEFEACFPFEETEGQLNSVRDIIADLTGSKTMDRVVCGDVGYGKTEVAMRAAYLTVMSGRQCAFLVPTTVLARQHFETLKQRFEGYPVKIGLLSRFNSRSENQEVVAGLASGDIDIVIGTHRLLQKDVDFAGLGLLVVDEEHRFGVKAKEHIKQLRRGTDVLTMTATPIPRTLQLALSGVRDLSLIETPPVDRLAIRTYVARFDEGLIRQAVKREVSRGGQVFYLHNRVGYIGSAAVRLQQLLPGLRVGIAHGQMKERQLEDVMVEFLEHRIDVLVCTSIIESGLDIPNANTIIVNRADTFGLAQLYQIRGRVGRSYRRAYAYLLVPAEGLVTPEARKRLSVLQELDHLGAGFRLAAHDMEIRGAGNLLGKQQSGQIAAVGFDLFMRMLEEAALELRGRKPGPRVEPEIELGAEAFLPERYVEDVGERLQLYRRMADAETREEVVALAEETEDRFGSLPPQALNFVRVMRLRPALKRLLVTSLKSSAGLVVLTFDDESPVDRDVLLRLATRSPRRYGIRPGGVFTAKSKASDFGGLADEIEDLLESLLEGLDEGNCIDGETDRGGESRIDRLAQV